MEPSHNLDLHQATLGAIGAIDATILINLLPSFKVLYSNLRCSNKVWLKCWQDIKIVKVCEQALLFKYGQGRTLGLV
jgi:hypothetical protein